MDIEKTVVVKKSETTDTKKSNVEKVVVPVSAPIVEDTKNKETFSEKQAEAAATAALKSAIEANSELAMKDAERTYAIEKKRNMLERCKKDRVVTRTVSRLYAAYLGRVYTFAYNGIPVTIYCDGKPHEYPEFVARHIDAKLNKISESNTYKEIIEEKLN